MKQYCCEYMACSTHFLLILVRWRTSIQKHVQSSYIRNKSIPHEKPLPTAVN